MSLRHSTACVLVAGLIAASAATHRAAADQIPQGPTFRSAADLVYVDVYPRRDGRIVDGLRLEDFRLREDGEPQAIELFSFVRVPRREPGTDLPEPRSAAEAERLAANPANRVSILFLDLYHTTRASSVQANQALIDFADRSFGAADMVGVMTQELPISQLTFSRRPVSLVRSLLGTPAWGRRDEAPPGQVMLHGPIEEEIAACAGGAHDALVWSYREDALFTSLENLVARLGVLRDARKHVFLFTEGWTVPRGNPPNIGRPIGMAGIARPIGGRPGQISGFGQSAILTDTICDTLVAKLTGLDWEQRFRDLLRQANAANVSFYPIDLGGLKVGLEIARADERIGTPPRNIPFSQTAAAQSLMHFRTLAENTDGRAVLDRNDIDAGLREILDDLGAYYVLGYYSTNRELDGKYREIDVDVIPPRTAVSARRGYFAGIDARPSPAEATARTAAAAIPPVVIDALDGLARLRDDAGVMAYAATWDDEIRVVVEIAGREATDDKWRSGAEVNIVVRSISNNAWERRATGRIDAGGRTALVTVPVAGWDVAPGAASAGGPGRAAPASAGATSPAPAAASFTVDIRVTGTADGALLEAEIPASIPAEALVSDPLVYRTTGPRRSALVAAAAFAFRRGELVQLHWRVSNAASEWRAQLLDRQGRPRADLPLVELPSGDGGTRTLMTTVPLASFAAGDYVIELTVTNGNRTTERLTAFRVTG